MMKKFLAGMIVLLAITCSGFAGTNFVVPEQKIIGADKPIKLGKLVRLKVSPVTTKPDNYVSSSYKWKVYDINIDPAGKVPPAIVEIEDVEDLGDHIFFGAGIENKLLTAQCIAVHTYAVKDKDGKIIEVGNQPNIITTTVTIGGTPPVPPGPNPPGPNPNPDPAPVFPDGKFKLSAKSYDLATKNVLPANRKKGADAVSSGCKSIAAAIAAGTITDPTSILKELKTKNNSNLQSAGVDVTEWDAFGLGLQKELVTLYKAKQLTVAGDYAVALLEIAAGLDKVK